MLCKIFFKTLNSGKVQSLLWHNYTLAQALLCAEKHLFMSFSHFLKLEIEEQHDPEILVGGQMESCLASMWAPNMIGTDVVMRLPNSKVKDSDTTHVTEFQCHKFILAARSKVFEAMFSHQMKETLTGHVDMHKMHPSTLKALLRYIYTNQVNAKDVDLHLLAVAEQFDMEELKDACATELSNQLTVKNATYLFIQAKMYRTEILAEAALEFIAENYPKVKKSDSWREYQHPELFQMLAETLALTTQS